MASPREPGRVDRFFEWGLIVCFLTLLALPGLRASLDGWHHQTPDELREPAPWPELSPLLEMTSDLEAFFEDRIGFRGPLLTLHGLLRAKLLHTQPNPQVLVGREGWLFFNGNRGLPETDRIVHQARGVRRLDRTELDGLREFFLGRQRAFEGVPYLMVIAPNKHTIYPEYLPPRMNRVSARTPLDQTLEMLAAETRLPVLDLRPPLLAAKPLGQLYYRTDSHWNALGAHVGYGEILRALSRWLPSLAPRVLEDFEVHWETQAGNMLAGLIALRGHYREVEPTLAPREPPRWRLRSDQEVFGSPWFAARPKLRDWFEDNDLVFRVYEVPDPSLPDAVFLVDSFGAWLMEPLAEHFQTVTFLHRRTQPGIVRRVVRELRPDVVVEELVEYALVEPRSAPEVEPK